MDIKIEQEKLDKKYIAYFRSPSLQDLKTFWYYIYKVNEPNETAEVKLLEACFIKGDEEMIDFEDHLELYLSYRNQIPQLLPMYKVELVDKDIVPEKYQQDEYEKDEFTYIRLTDSDKEYFGVFKKPGFSIYSKVKLMWDKENYFEGQLEMAKSTFVAGDKILIDFNNHPLYFNSYKEYMTSIIQVYDNKFYDLIIKSQISKDPEQDILQKQKALILANLGIDTYGMDDPEHFSELWAQCKYILENSPKIS